MVLDVSERISKQPPSFLPPFLFILPHMHPLFSCPEEFPHFLSAGHVRFIEEPSLVMKDSSLSATTFSI